jgi:hypothetical protein
VLNFRLLVEKETAPRRSRGGGSSPRLLVIEDEDRLSGILKSKLGDVGFTVDIAGSAADPAPRSS